MYYTIPFLATICCEILNKECCVVISRSKTTEGGESEDNSSYTAS